MFPISYKELMHKYKDVLMQIIELQFLFQNQIKNKFITKHTIYTDSYSAKMNEY